MIVTDEVKRDFLDEIEIRPELDQAALSYAQAGLSVVPCVLPGKYPPFGWLMYQGSIADQNSIKQWYANNPTWGLGLVCGSVSGGLEVIDLDGGAFAEAYNQLIRNNAKGLFEKLLIERSPSGGLHYAYRCATIDEGNTAIAKTAQELPGHKRGADGLTTLIETRGQGGYIVVYPTRGYQLIQGDWTQLSELTIEERNLLWSCAAMLDESEKAVIPAASAVPLVLPPARIDQLNAMHALLQRHGWTLVKSVKDQESWRRPGKDEGISATWNYIEDRFYVFSSNAAPFKNSHSYTSAQIQHLLEPENTPLKDRPITEKIYLTDMGNARRFALRFSDQFRYNPAWGWMNWNGQKWERDSGEKIMQAARHTVRLIFDEARDAVNPEDSKAIGKWALGSQSRNKLEAMIKLAQTEEGLTEMPDAFDSNPFILNTDSGIIDLCSGDLRPHEHDALLSKIAGTGYGLDQDCPRWLSFIDRIMDGNSSLVHFLQRAVGYSLTGVTTEQCFFLCYGTGSNGKSVFLETLRGVLNEYATTAEFSTFLAKQNDNVRNDIASLAGARFVASSESGADKRLSETIIKALTGGDTITARFLFQEYFQFKPQFKVWMATNHKPVIRDTDLAIWRRVRLIPFAVTIPESERNLHLIEDLKSEYPAILAWAVRGCIEWAQKGLGTPEEVIKATENYRDDMDIMAQFIEDCCIVKPEVSVQSTAIYSRYSKWCEVNNEKPMTQREFSLRLAEKGYIKDHNRNGSYWPGIGILQDDM